MVDPTPPPLGDLTRRWTHLTDRDRREQTHRLLDGVCPGEAVVHVDRPALDRGLCYRRLVPAAAGGDEVALAWLATTHRPLLVARGRALLEQDPAEWGAACLEVLHTTLARADLQAGRWLRRRVAQHLARHLARLVAHHLHRHRRESPTAPTLLEASWPRPAGSAREGPLDLSLALDRALGRLDRPTRDAFYALADDKPLEPVADRHGLSHAAVRQRVVRARRRLQPELATYRRAHR